MALTMIHLSFYLKFPLVILLIHYELKALKEVLIKEVVTDISGLVSN
jgi:hypothetical protein